MSYSMGRFSYGKPKVHWGGNHSKLTIGMFCSIAKNCNVYFGGNHNTEWVTTYPFGHIYKEKFNKFNGEGHPATKGDVTIGHDVWIGENPAQLIRKRFTDEQIEKLLEIKWWFWKAKKINEFTNLLCDKDIDKFITCALKS